MTTQLDGTSGNDTLTGTSGNDLIQGFAGNDRLNGLAGNDTLDGGSGTNQIDAGEGDDTILIDGTASSANVHIPATGIDGGAGIDTIALSGTQADYHVTNVVGFGLQITDLTTSQRTLATNVEHLTFADGEVWLVPKPNTPATLGGDQFGAVSEDGVLQAQGQLTVTDPDAGEAGFQAAGLIGTYGSLTLTETGSWTYALNNNALVVQALTAGQVMTELFTVQTLDGTAAQISIDVTGADDTGLILGTAGNDVLTGTRTDDRLFGQDGDDRLTGRAGNDVLTGGAGGDRFVFSGKFGADVVSDFDTAQRGEFLSLRSVDGLRGFRDLVAHHLTEVDGDAVITVGGAQIVLDGVAMADLTAQDFLF